MDGKVGLAACGERRARWRGGAACGCQRGVLPTSAVVGDARRPAPCHMVNLEPRIAMARRPPELVRDSPGDLSSAPALSSYVLQQAKRGILEDVRMAEDGQDVPVAAVAVSF